MINSLPDLISTFKLNSKRRKIDNLEEDFTLIIRVIAIIGVDDTDTITDNQPMLKRGRTAGTQFEILTRLKMTLHTGRYKRNLSF
mgnify:FL=1